MFEYYIGALIFTLGACMGSFANVIIYRWPKSLSLIRPGSHCVSCQRKIPFYENIPLLSCLLLKAKCRSCKVYFGYSHFLVELLTGGLFLAVYLKFGLSLFALEYCLFVFGLVTITFIDLEHRLIPDFLSLSGIVLGLFFAWFNPEKNLGDAFLGALLGGGFFWLIAFLYYKFKGDHGLGGGDIKLMAWIGATLGLSSVLFVVIFSSLLGSLVGIAIMVKTKEGLKTTIPYGPFLALGALLYLFYGPVISGLYYSFFFPWLDTSSGFDKP